MESEQSKQSKPRSRRGPRGGNKGATTAPKSSSGGGDGGMEMADDNVNRKDGIKKKKNGEEDVIKSNRRNNKSGGNNTPRPGSAADAAAASRIRNSGTNSHGKQAEQEVTSGARPNNNRNSNNSNANNGRRNQTNTNASGRGPRKNNNNASNHQANNDNDRHSNNSNNKSKGQGDHNGSRHNSNSSNNRRNKTAEERENKSDSQVNNGKSGNNNGSGRQQQQQSNNKRNGNSNNKSRTKKINYEAHATLPSCLHRYTTNEPTIIRGKLRVMPSKNGASFVTCDRGSLSKDVLIKDEKDRNRGLDGDYVFVELYPLQLGEEDEGGNGGEDKKRAGGERKGGGKDVTLSDFMTNLELNDMANNYESCKDVRGDNIKAKGMDDKEKGMDVEYEEEEYLIGGEDNEVNARAEAVESQGEDVILDDEEEVEMWHDDEVQMSLWDPVLNLRKRSKTSITNQGNDAMVGGPQQRSGKVIFIIPPKSSAGQQPSELNPEESVRGNNQKQSFPKRTIVGTLTLLPNSQNGPKGGIGRYLLVPNNKSLPRFMCPLGTKPEQVSNANDDTTGDDDKNNNDITPNKTLYRAEYTHGSWHATAKWPACTNVTRLCGTCNVEDETRALIVENGVDHGEFSPDVLRDVEESVKSGRFFDKEDMGWKPTEEMCRGRRDYRNHRVFTIDPTTAKDLDDALHITPLPDGRVEIGVHIADVSHFIQPDSAVDTEALKRATTVYLVNDVIPMLPRPLCEIACSLNENVERLAFSCVWRMNMDGTLSKKKGGGSDKEKPQKDDIWYGRTVIKSCARLDYATAQNIIDKKVANGEKSAVDETYWPKSRHPTGGHTIEEVAADVRLMHKVAMARRKLRFDNGALALNGVKLAFQLEEDGETPKLCAPYPIRDSNRLIEEFMLLANFLVAQRLITHAHGRALLRNHSPPIELGMQQVVDVSRESFNFDIDTTNSNTLQESLSRLSRECNDELVVQCVTECLMTPMRPAEYMAAGELDEVDWQHFALNIPYYTHFTSPIRRYPDVIVHRLLQATLDDDVDDYPSSQKEIHAAAGHCNEMRMSAKKAQERSDRVFLSLYLKKNPISSVLGVCLGVGEKTFTVFVPSLGMSTRVFLQEHEDEFLINAFEDSNSGKRRLIIQPKTNAVPGSISADEESSRPSWKSLDIRVFTKLEVACTCKMQPPIDVRVKVVGPWTG